MECNTAVWTAITRLQAYFKWPSAISSDSVRVDHQMSTAKYEKDQVSLFVQACRGISVQGNFLQMVYILKIGARLATEELWGFRPHSKRHDLNPPRETSSPSIPRDLISRAVEALGLLRLLLLTRAAYSPPYLLDISGSACQLAADNVFGPVILGCSHADLTLLFEQSILSIGPSALLLCVASWRTFHVRHKSIKILKHRGLVSKLVLLSLSRPFGEY